MPLPPKLQARHECLTLIVLGATGNLAQRKLFPSLFNLFAAGQLPPRVRVVAAARDGHSDESFGDVLRASIADAWATQRRRCAQGMECTGDGDGDGDGDETTRDRGGRPPTPTSTSISSASPSKASSARAPFDAFKIQADVELDLKMRGVVAPVLPSNTATIPPALVNEFLALVRFARFNAAADDASTSPPSASSLLSDVFALTRAHEAEHADAACLAHNRLFYLALPHALYAAVSGAFYTLVPIRPRRRGERRSLRTFAGASLRPGSPAFNARPRRLSTSTDAFELHPDIASYGTALRRRRGGGSSGFGVDAAGAREAVRARRGVRGGAERVAQDAVERGGPVSDRSVPGEGGDR
jgi:hypothetical protein